jgi:hypothetical protein
MMRHPLAQATLDKVGPDEPIFVLRAQDMLADNVVDFWADIMQQKSSPRHPKVIAARQIARDMRDYQSRKIPD